MFKKVVGLRGSARASTLSRTSPHATNQSPPAKRALTHTASSWEAPHYPESNHSPPTPGSVKPVIKSKSH